jgi:hypothetical protein
VTEGEEGGRHPLHAADRAAQARRGAPGGAEQDALEEQGDGKAKHGRDEETDEHAEEPIQVTVLERPKVDRPRPGIEEGRADEATDQGVARTRRQAPTPGVHVPDHGAGEPCPDDRTPGRLT